MISPIIIDTLNGAGWRLVQKTKPAPSTTQPTSAISLDEWESRELVTVEDATVPGVVHFDLWRAGIIGDPFVGSNELNQRWIALSSWEYTKRFELSEQVLAHKQVLLDCEAIDTVASVKINGKEVLKANNMFVRYIVDIKPFLKREGVNEISFLFESPVQYARSMAARYPYKVPCPDYIYGESNRNFIRKCGCDFGWDWGPCFASMGIIKPLRLVATSDTLITYVTVDQVHHDSFEGKRNVDVTVTTHFRNVPEAEARGILQVAIKNPHGEAITKKHQEVVLAGDEQRIATSLTLENISDKEDLWWCLGYGKQPLFGVEVQFIPASNGSFASAHHKKMRIGLRDIRLVTTPDNEGESFYFSVNGVPVFAKGANWIPIDCFHVDSVLTLADKTTRARRLNELLSSAAASHMNMLRVWGGGIYEDDRFYELCDELGILVWQDFMFACSSYPANQEFLDNVLQEVVHQIKRLQHHPCIAVWSGNNENEEALISWPDFRMPNEAYPSPRYVIDYNRLNVDTIYERGLKKEDPNRPFWPSSPSNGLGAWGNPQDRSRGDCHYWAVWHQNRPFSDYLTVVPRFCSEFGFQSLPSFETLAPFLSPGGEDDDAFNITSPEMEYRQRSPLVGNRAILEHIARHFRMPNSFQNFIYVSQVLQALAIKMACEHWRRQKQVCMGALYWQLNDIWPGNSWSSLEYDGKWKMLHYEAVRFFAPVLVSSFEDSDGNIQIWVTSDLKDRSIEGSLHIEVYSWDTGAIISSSSLDFFLPALASAVVFKHNVAQFLDTIQSSRQNCFLVLRVTDENGSNNNNNNNNNNEVIASNTHFFCPLKQVKLQRTQIQISNLTRTGRNFSFTLSCDKPCPFVYIRNTKALSPTTAAGQKAPYRGGRFSDNNFLLLPGQPRRVEFIPFDEDDDMDVDAFAQQLSVVSLRDSY